MKTKNIYNIMKVVHDSCEVMTNKAEELNEICEGDFFSDVDELTDENFEQHREELQKKIEVIINECKNLYNLVKHESK